MGEFAAFFSSFTWALGSTVYSDYSLRHGARSVNFTRALLAFPCFALVSFFLSGRAGWAQLNGLSIAWLFASMVASYGIGDGLFYLSARKLGVPGALALCSLYPLWNTLVGFAFLGQKIGPTQVVGIGVTLVFVTLVILTQPQKGAKNSRASRSTLISGIVLGLLTSLFWSVNSIAVSQAGVMLDPWVLNTMRMLIAMGVTGSLAWVMDRKLNPVIPSREMSWTVVAIFVFESFGGSATFTYGLSHVPLAIGSILTGLSPVLAVPIAWARRSEPVSVLRLGCIAGVLVGLWLLMGGASG